MSGREMFMFDPKMLSQEVRAIRIANVQVPHLNGIPC